MSEFPKRSTSTHENHNVNLGDYRCTENGDLLIVETPDIAEIYGKKLDAKMPFTNKRLESNDLYINEMDRN